MSKLTPAWKVKKKARGDGVLDDYINDIINDAEIAIQEAVDNRLTKTTIQLQTNFDVQTMDNQRAQKYIYFYAIQELEEAKYRARISFKGNKSESQRVFLHVEWFTSKDQRIEEYMHDFLSSRTVNIQKTSMPGGRVIRSSNSNQKGGRVIQSSISSNRRKKVIQTNRRRL
jgi:hypothetical protein